MREPTFITRDPPANPGLDFEELRRRGIEILQELSGAVWTDYNEHDPGVTTLEQLCYALTELSYRANLPVDALLREPRAGTTDGRRSGLFAPSAILTSGPVTERDWRRLLIDRVPHLSNVWLTPARGRKGPAGLHELTLYVADPQITTNAAARRSVCRAARRVYIGHRRLGEDLGAIRILHPAAATVSGSLEVAADANPDAVLADVFYRVQLLLAPEPRRQSSDDRMSQSRLPAQIFTGPLLRGAPITDDQLTARPAQITLGELTRAIAGVPGILGASGIALATATGRIEPGGAATLTVAPGQIVRLESRYRHGDISFRLFVRGVERRPDGALVDAELQRLWSDHRRDMRRPPDPPSTSDLPAIDAAQVRAYDSLQAHFPIVYGVGPFGLPANASPQRKAQARQFKGYLHIFEQLLANQFARLAAARDAFSTAATGKPQHWQALTLTAGDSTPLLSADYPERLQTIAGRHDRALIRRNKVLDLMLAVYGESLDVLWPRRGEEQRAGGDTAAIRAQIRAKRQLLRHLPWLGHRRGGGLDYRNHTQRSRRRGQSALEVRSRIELGMSAMPRDLTEALADAGVRLIGSADPGERAAMIRHAHHIETTFAPVPHIPWTDATAAALPAISEELLIAASHPAGFRIGQLPDDSAITAVCRAASQSVWQLVGRFPDHQAAVNAIATLTRVCRQLTPHIRRLTIVEHVLLRFGSAAADSTADDFTATAVVALPGREAADPAVRQTVRRVLDANAPAHLVLDVVYLRLSQAAAFDELHNRWRRALTHERGKPLIEACRTLRAFLDSDRS